MVVYQSGRAHGASIPQLWMSILVLTLSLSFYMPAVVALVGFSDMEKVEGIYQRYIAFKAPKSIKIDGNIHKDVWKR